MRIVFFMYLFCLCMICVAKDAKVNIRVANGQKLDIEKWDLYFQECISKNYKSCQFIIEDGLKDVQSCDAKKECHIIGEIYWIANDIEKSMSFFKKACDKMESHGCYYIALSYEKDKDFVRAKQYYENACERKNMSACFKLGTFYENGFGVRQDYYLANEFYKKACKNKQPQSCYSIATLYYNGDGLTHDLSMAKEFYGISCDLGLQIGCDRYKELNQSGIPSLYSKRNIF